MVVSKAVSKIQDSHARDIARALKLTRGKIALTGAAGFIGARLGHHLLEAGVEGDRMILVDEKPFHFGRNCAKVFAGKIPHTSWLSAKDFIHNLSAHNPELILHMGACSSTTDTREDYLNEINTEYSKKLWDWCVSNGRSFYYASSAATYGNGEFGYNDDLEHLARLKPLNLYGQSKQRFDLYVLDQISAGKTPNHWCGFKFFNVYGPVEDHKASMASVAFHARNQFLSQGFVKLFRSHKEGIRDGEQKRDFVFVDDVCNAVLYFAAQQGSPGIYNLGSGQARSFKDLVLAVAKSMGVEGKIEFINTPDNIRDKYQYWTQADLTNLRNAGYQCPMTSLEKGVDLYMQELAVLGFDKGRKDLPG